MARDDEETVSGCSRRWISAIGMILTINTGSSSVKLGLFQAEGDVVSDLKRTRFSFENNTSAKNIKELLTNFLAVQLMNVEMVVHRVVHGGSISSTQVIDAALEGRVEELSELAPLHNPFALAWIRGCKYLFRGEVSQVAVFDTAFFVDLPNEASTYALPRDLCRQFGIRRYGFHGIAHEAMWHGFERLRPHGKKVISIQLGSGCSITATRDGTPIDTSMGFSPLEGLVMSHRCGDIDPGLLLFLQRKGPFTATQLEDILNHASGLSGLSGTSGDMRELLISKDPAVQLAVSLYCYRVKKYIGAYMAALGDAEAIVFGGGVGENSPEIRARILSGLEWCGITLDEDRNLAAQGVEATLSRDASRVEVFVIPVDEEMLMVQKALPLVSNKGKPSIGPLLAS